MAKDWHNINDLYWTPRNEEPKSEPVDINEEEEQQPEKEVEVRLSDPKFIRPDGDYQENKPCKMQVSAEYLKKTIRARVLFDVFSSYKDKKEIREYSRLEGFIEDGIAVAEMKYLPLNEDYYCNEEKTEDSKYEVRFVAYHNTGEKPVESKPLEMPQIKICRVPVLTFSKNYTKVNAYNLSIFADLAYCPDETIETYFKEFGKSKSRNFNTGNSKIKASPFLKEVFEDEKFITEEGYIFSDKKTDTQFFIAYSSKQILISIRGTKQLKDWLQNIKADEVDFTEGAGQVHQGFYECFKFVKREIDKFLITHSGKEIVITGHSLGGAVATITAAYIRKNITDKVMLYTFGSPRAGNKTFSEYFSRTKPLIHFRCVNDKDLVTNVPLPGMELNTYCVPIIKLPFFIIPLDLDGDLYSHVGTIVYVHTLNSTDAVVTPDYKNKPYITAGFKNVDFKESVNINALSAAWENVSDHYMENYFAYLKNDLSKCVRLYPGIKDVNIKEMDKDVALMEKEINELKQTKNQLNKAEENHEILAKEHKNDSFLRSFHLKEAADIRYKISKLDTIIANREIDVTNYNLTVDYYRKNRTAKESILKELIGESKADESIEREIKYSITSQ